MTFKPLPRALYTTGSSDPEWMICLPDGRCWDLYEGMDMLRGGWDWHPDCTAARVEIARDLSDAEIASLAASDTRPGAVAAIISARRPCKAERALEGRSTLYLTPREPAVLHESGNLWILYATGSELSPPRPVPSEWIEIAQDLTSAEVASLVDPDKRFLSIFKILSARKPAPGGCDEAEVERWRTAAERAEADRQEWQALCLSHEGAIERLTRERDAARESLSATSSALRLARAEADEAHRRADAAEPEVERLRGIVVALAARLAGL